MRGGFGVTFKAVLWSPVGAPAGVPGPRRNADECDAGWFAPVATRRRPMFGALRAPSLWLAASPGGRPPGTPRMGHRPRQPSGTGPGAWVALRGPEGRWGFRGSSVPLCADAYAFAQCLAASEDTGRPRKPVRKGHPHAWEPRTGEPAHVPPTGTQSRTEASGAVRAKGDTNSPERPREPGAGAGGGLPGRGVLSASRQPYG